jgi:hypothetical protein
MSTMMVPKLAPTVSTFFMSFSTSHLVSKACILTVSKNHTSSRAWSSAVVDEPLYFTADVDSVRSVITSAPEWSRMPCTGCTQPANSQRRGEGQPPSARECSSTALPVRCFGVPCDRGVACAWDQCTNAYVLHDVTDAVTPDDLRLPTSTRLLERHVRLCLEPGTSPGSLQGAVQGCRACVHTPKQMALPEGHHRLPRGTSTNLLPGTAVHGAS